MLLTDDRWGQRLSADVGQPGVGRHAVTGSLLDVHVGFMAERKEIVHPPQ